MTDTNPIRILDSHVIDCIAAGEVVDRPGHMIKELCENSIDAGATEIVVDYKNGGRDVVIRDNGWGMQAGDLPLALARHGTSKIITADDLWSVNSYGFRGEALASISAVSDLTILSRVKQQDMGAKISSHFGVPTEVLESGADYGTTIEVRDLFQNLPARLKFLKTESGENTAIKNQLRALALANPQITFRILQEKELIFFWPSCPTLPERVAQVLETESLFYGEATLEDFNARVVVSSPGETVRNSRQIWLFVRGRFVQDRSLQTAVLEAYRHLLMHGEYPTVAVYLDCPADELDVNVSPTKSQVKFRRPGIAFRCVQRAVRGVLEKAPWIAPLLGDRAPSAHRDAVESAVNRFSTAAAAVEYSPEHNLSFPSKEFDQTNFKLKDSGSSNITLAKSRDRQPLDTSHTEFARNEGSAPLGRVSWQGLDLVGQVHLTYIVAQKEDAVIFIDQHAAHERIMFERLMNDYKQGRVEVQNFLLPEVFKISADAVNAMMQAKSEIEKLGLFLESMGPEEIVVQGAPAILKPEALANVIEKLAQDYAELGTSLQMERKLGELMSTMACHSAVRAGQALSHDEMRALLTQMDEHPLSSFCPHGRPVYVEYPLRKLEKDFGRIV